MTADDLLPCPFCGSAGKQRANAAHARTRNGKRIGYRSYIHCYQCGAMGPHEPSKVAAIAAWNQRKDDK